VLVLGSLAVPIAGDAAVAALLPLAAPLRVVQATEERHDSDQDGDGNGEPSRRSQEERNTEIGFGKNREMIP
jgi:hypothetical protein